MEDLARKVCVQIEKFMVSSQVPKSRALINDPSKVKNTAEVYGGQGQEWMVGEGRISVEQLVLVSLKRISVGCWVPTIRLINDPRSVPSHGPSLESFVN